MEARDDRFDERDRARFDGNRAALDAAAGWRSGESVLRVERAAAKSFVMYAVRLAASPAQSIGRFRVGAWLAVLMQRRSIYRSPVPTVSRMLRRGGVRYTAGTMKPRKLVKEMEGIAAAYCVTDGKKFRLKDFDPGDTHGVKSKKVALSLLEGSGAMLAEMQEKLYAQDVWALLLIFQGIDTAGKDGAIKHVMSGINPQGCDVYRFNAPTHEELDHDFLWREHKVVPGRGKIGIFNRSYYEEVLVVRVHPQYLKNEKLPDELATKHIWEERYEDINAFERFLTRNGVVIRKFFLNISKEEQKKRFLSRLEDSKKNWKFSMDDIKERKC